jgi:AcrR family transcriptional regulator
MSIQERKEREKEHRKEEILDAAQKTFFEKGLGIATMDEIAVVAELSKGTLYLYYKSKEDLYLAVMMRGIQKLTEMIQHVVESNEPTLKKIMNVGECYVEFFRTSPNYFRMIHFSQLPHFHRQVSEEMKEQCGLEMSNLWNLVIGLFRNAIDEKSIRPEFNPIELTIILWSSATALMLRIDNEFEVWKKKMQIDLNDTLKLSNSLLWNAMLTEKGRIEFQLFTK